MYELKSFLAKEGGYIVEDLSPMLSLAIVHRTVHFGSTYSHSTRMIRCRKRLLVFGAWLLGNTLDQIPDPVSEHC